MCFTNIRILVIYNVIIRYDTIRLYIYAQILAQTVVQIVNFVNFLKQFN